MRGVDNTAEYANRAWDRTEEILKKLKSEANLDPKIFSNLLDCLNAQRSYVKSHFPWALQFDSQCQCHCVSWATSDEKKKEFRRSCFPNHSHKETCKWCHQLPDLFACIAAQVQLNEAKFDAQSYQEMVYDLRDAFNNIKEQKLHVIRTFVQQYNWSERYHGMDTKTAFLTMDWVSLTAFLYHTLQI